MLVSDFFVFVMDTHQLLRAIHEQSPKMSSADRVRCTELLIAKENPSDTEVLHCTRMLLGPKPHRNENGDLVCQCAWVLPYEDDDVGWHWKDGKREGLERHRDEHRRLTYEVEWRNGKKHGLEKVFEHDECIYWCEWVNGKRTDNKWKKTT